ncbi:SagB/ThcOx family dehydrogenase [Prevotella sp. KH2C16]|uniref:SagB/ThcOx family dehydrogenase n=1 Tax=Prevotella sp. KH2C16 TaxID=1855325 RepID=UPI0008E57264|nr:SagB/ThcOx family dehydrogenase [Prevotella sp. KH2C16]SFF90710.1 Nitroreductase [Prevotella sp. KH2C16]
MKRLLMMMAFVLMGMSAMAQDVIPLPTPDKNVEMSLFTALQRRRSVREYASRPIDLPTLSRVLWAACGISQPESGKITAASAMNRQDIQVYVCGEKGAYLFHPATNELTKVCGKDLRASLAGSQKGVATAPCFLLLVSDQAKFGGRGQGETFGAMDAGYVSQNIYLACTSLGLGTVARYGMDRDTLKRELGLADTQVMELNHPVGWTK